MSDTSERRNNGETARRELQSAHQRATDNVFNRLSALEIEAAKRTKQIEALQEGLLHNEPEPAPVAPEPTSTMADSVYEALFQNLPTYKVARKAIAEIAAMLGEVRYGRMCDITKEIGTNPHEFIEMLWRVGNVLKEGQQKPAPDEPEPTSEGLWQIKWHNDGSYYFDKATDPQVRAEAERRGLLDTPRQTVAEAFLHAALGFDDDPDSEQTYDQASYWYSDIAKDLHKALNLYGNCWKQLGRMAAVLQAAAKDEG